jgi:AraC-like DNA-binding protein
VQDDTLAARRRLYLLSRVFVARNYRRRLTLAEVAGAVSSSPRQVQRAYAQFGELSFHEDLRARRLTAAAQLLAEQPAIPVAAVARLVGYRQAAHFAGAFRRRYGIAPALFRERARAHHAQAREREAPSSPTAAGSGGAAPRASSSSGASTASGGSVSAPASRTRISVPPPVRSAETLPPCWSTT